MNYLAINTAVGTEILLFYKGRDYYCNFPQKTKSGGLVLPAAEQLLKKAGARLKDLDVFACVVGPGSFTGIRIGVATVRALAYSLNKPIAAVTYFQLLAYNNTPLDALTQPFTAAVDGGAGATYLKNFDGSDSPPLAVKAEDILKHSHKKIVTDPFFSLPISGLTDEYEVSSIENTLNPLKAAVELEIKKGVLLGFNDLIPLYLRRSQPEREAGEV